MSESTFSHVTAYFRLFEKKNNSRGEPYNPKDFAEKD